MSLFFPKRDPERQLQELLIAHADALVSDTLDVDKLLKHYDQATLGQAEGLLNLAERISRSLIGVTPSEQFVDRLRRQLNETVMLEHRSWWGRIRQLPPRTQLAAGIGGATLTAGVVLIIAARPVLDALGVWRNRRAAAA